MREKALVEVKIPGLKRFARGKVREVFDLGSRLLIVATDRISAFDFVLPTPIPGKGKILSQFSLFWFGCLKKIIKNHLLTSDILDYPDYLKRYEGILSGRSMLVAKTERIDLECIVRGYLAGSGWKEYKEKGEVCGIRLPKGLREGERLPQPIFTPTTKAIRGHDQSISFSQMVELIGEERAEALKQTSLGLYTEALAYSFSKGLILADTKFEFGLLDGEVIWIDEALSPDSSRYWSQDEYQPGRAGKGFDKEYLRSYLHSIGWEGGAPAPELPIQVVKELRARYEEALKMLTGRGID